MYIYSLYSGNMGGGRKFKFSARKNEERKRAAKAKLIKPTQDLDAQPDMTVSLPLTAFTAGVLLAKGGHPREPQCTRVFEKHTGT